MKKLIQKILGIDLLIAERQKQTEILNKILEQCTKTAEAVKAYNELVGLK